MKYQAQTITVKTSLGDVNVEAMIGVGSGLAYHKELAEDPGFVLTQVSTGARIPCEYVVTEEHEAQRWLELVATIVDWNQGLQTTGTALAKLEPLVNLVEASLDEAVRTGRRVMITTDIPVATYGDPDITMDGEMLTQETAQVYADSLEGRTISDSAENGQVINYRVLGGRLQSDGDFYNPHKGQVIAICEEVVNE